MRKNHKCFLELGGQFTSILFKPGKHYNYNAFVPVNLLQTLNKVLILLFTYFLPYNKTCDILT